ncbi:MAG: PaaI family thioesterase [Desulfuromonadaceae bacterium]
MRKCFAIEASQNLSRDCFICGVENKYGVKTRFYQSRDKEVIAVFTLLSQHQSYPGIAHGGLSGAILDETIGRAIMPYHDQNTFGVTLDLHMRYRHPVPLDTQLHAIGRVTREQGRTFEGSGELLLPDGKVAVSAHGKYIKRRAEQIADASFETEAWFEPRDPTPQHIEVATSKK